MFYTRLSVTCDPGWSEILIAELAEAGFESFLETEKGFETYAEGEDFDRQLLIAIREKYGHLSPLQFSEDRIKKKNWNEEWEKNLEQIVVENKCLIRAEFQRAEKKYPFEIIITPKMSFGTGHHPTTYLMIKNQLAIDHSGKRVMDVGCGTAILSIMASKLGAKAVEAFDIDDWSVINAKENIANNFCSNIRIQRGSIHELTFTGSFDIIIANINKNVLLRELKIYAQYLVVGGKILLSGIYINDLDDLRSEGACNGLAEVRRDERQSWAALLLQKE